MMTTCSAGARNVRPLLFFAAAFAAASLIALLWPWHGLAAAPITFGAASNYGTSASNSRHAASGDVNNDGRQDVVVANGGSSTISVLLGDGSGRLSLRGVYSAGFGPVWVALADFNNDGNLDAAMACQNGNYVTVLQGNGLGDFSYRGAFFTYGNGQNCVATGDFNRDGKMDIAAVNESSGSLGLLLGYGNFNFSFSGPFGTGGTIPGYLAAGDVNNDGRLDVVVANAVSNSVSTLLGNGAGGLSLAGITTSGGTTPRGVAIGDLDADGKPDVGVANQDTNNIRILRGNGLGGFSPGAVLSTGGGQPHSVAIGDLNGDGKQDVATSNIASDTVGVFAGDGTGGFGAVTTFATGQQPRNAVMVDLDNDGRLDLATANATSNNASVLLNTTQVGTWTNFEPGSTHGVNATPVSIAKGDLNGDGKLDLAVANYTANTLSVLLGNGSGSFGAATPFVTGAGPYGIAAGDVDKDGDLDLVTANLSGNSVSVLLGNGSGSFGAPGTFGAGNSSRSVAMGDLDRDGDLDLVTANWAGNNVSVLLGNGAGGFGAPGTFATASGPQHVTLGDVNKDGRLDAAVANNNSNNVSVLLGNGAGGFGAAANLAAGSAPNHVAMADLNKDGNPDLVTANSSSNDVSVLLGNGAGGFGAATNFGVGATRYPRAVAVGDLNNDGRLDLVLSNQNYNTVAVLLGDGAGRFGSATYFNATAWTWAVALGDFNSDGRLDIAASNDWTSSVAILMNRDTAPPSGGTISINGGAQYTNTTAVSLALFATDGGSGVYQMRISNDGVFDSPPEDWQGYTTPKAWTLAGGDGPKTVYVQYKDLAGNSSSSVAARPIALDTRAPTGSVLINGGAPYTNTTAVTLDLPASDPGGSGIYQMRISNDGVFDSPAEDWQGYGTPKAWTLAGGDGLKTVYVQVRDNAGNISSTFTDTIDLDTTAPSGSVLIDGGAPYTNTISVTLGLSASDSGSGIYQVRMSNDGVFDSPAEDWQGYTTPKAWTLDGGDGAKTVYVQYKDNAGNASGSFTDTIVLDRQGPTTGFLESPTHPDPNEWYANDDPQFGWAATDPSGIGGYSFEFDQNPATEPDEISQGMVTEFRQPDVASGEHFMHVRAQDGAGNWGPASHRRVRIDTEPPVTQAVTIDGGASYANTTTVTLDLAATDNHSGVMQLRASNDGIFDTEPWFSYETTIPWTLDAPDGEKTVYVQYYDMVGNASNLATDTIILDTTAPSPVTDLTATAGNGKVDLAWSNPTTDFASTRILRSRTGYATSPESSIEQTITHEGTETASTDTSLTNGASYFYTAFVKDSAANWSLPVTATATPKAPTRLVASGNNVNWQFGAQVRIRGTLTSDEPSRPIMPRLATRVETLGARLVTVWRSANGTSWTPDGLTTWNPGTSLYEATRTITAKTYFQLRYAGEPDRLSSVSNTVALTCRAYLGRPWTVSSAPTHGRYFYTYGYLKPKHAGTTRLYFYRYYAGRWRLYTYRNATNYNYLSYTRYRLYYRLPYAGAWYVKAYHSDASHLAAYSPIRYFTVR